MGARLVCTALCGVGLVGTAFISTASAAITFAPAVTVSTLGGTLPNDVAVGDFNADGRPDLAVTNKSTPGNVLVLLATGAFTFAAPTFYGVGSDPDGLATTDLNGDGILDLVVTNSSSGSISTLLGTGAGSFSAAASTTVGTLPIDVTVADFNNDGKPDAAVTNFTSGSVSVLLGNGNGGYASNTATTVASSPDGIDSGDFNHDGFQDLAIAQSGASTVAILLNNGAGAFPAVSSTPTAGTGPFDVAVGDFSRNGAQDLAVALGGANVGSNLVGSGNGTFVPGPVIGSVTAPQAVAVGDFDGDANQDLTFAGSGGATGFQGSATGAFTALGTISLGGLSPSAIATGDFNRDGSQDIVGVNSGSATVGLLRNAPALQSGTGTLTFASTPQGSSSASQSFTLTNVGSAPLTVPGFTFSGTNPDDFSISSNTCQGAPVQAGGNCTVQVRFTPQGQNSRTALVTTSSNAPVQITIILNGTGGALPAGATGSTGPTGATGATGPAGPAGKNATVTCKVKKKGATKVKVTCTVKLASARHGRVSWRLTRAGRTYAHGDTYARHGRAAIHVPGVNRLPAGRYKLRVAGAASGAAFVVG